MRGREKQDVGLFPGLQISTVASKYLILISIVTEVAGTKPFTARSFLQKIAQLFQDEKNEEVAARTFELIQCRVASFFNGFFLTK